MAELGATIVATKGEVEASLWITNDTEWIFPDDARLWRHLIDSVENGIRPLLLARKIAVSTFPLLKQLGAFGVQLHTLYLPPRPGLLEVYDRALGAGPPTGDPATIPSHPAISEHLRPALLEPWVVDDRVREGLAAAKDLQLHIPSGDSLARLRAWANYWRTMPTPWKAQLTRYERCIKT